MKTKCSSLQISSPGYLRRTAIYYDGFLFCFFFPKWVQCFGAEPRIPEKDLNALLILKTEEVSRKKLPLNF